MLQALGTVSCLLLKQILLFSIGLSVISQFNVYARSITELQSDPMCFLPRSKTDFKGTYDLAHLFGIATLTTYCYLHCIEGFLI